MDFGFQNLDWRTTLHFLLALASAGPMAAQQPRLAEPALARRLDQPVTLAWQGQHLGPALVRLAEVQGLPLWIDRRVNTGATVDLAASDEPLSTVLDRLANVGDADAWGWSTLGQVVYFGPRQTARELATLSTLARQAISQALAARRRIWLTPTAWEFPRLSEPRGLLHEVLAPLDASVRNEGAMPHDLWPARSLPAVAPIDRVVLLLAGFDLAGEPTPDAGAWRLAPINHPVQMTRDYPRTAAGEAAVRSLAEADLEVRVRTQGRRLQVAARWEDHERLRAAIRGDAVAAPAQPREQPSPAGERRFTLTIENKPVGRVLEQLAAQLQLTLVWDEQLVAAAPPPREALVSCNVREASLDELLEAILAPAGLAFTRDAQTVTIRADK